MEQVIASNAAAPAQGCGAAGSSATDKWMSGSMACIEKGGFSSSRCASKPKKTASPETAATKNRFAALSSIEAESSLGCFEYVPEQFGLPYSQPIGWTAAKAKSDAARLQAPRILKTKWLPLACPLMELPCRALTLAPASEKKSTEDIKETATKTEELLCSLGVWNDPKTGFRRVRSVMDSGATKGVMHPDSFPDFPIQPSPGSKRGAVFGTAGSDELPNLGMWTLPALTAEGNRTMLASQVAEVSLPLSSVGEKCDEGNVVIFSSKGGLICNVQNGTLESFNREEGVYVLEQWVPPASAVSGFTRQ